MGALFSHTFPMAPSEFTYRISKVVDYSVIHFSEDFRCFWVAFDDGKIALGRYDEYFPMMTFRSASSNLPAISYVGVASDDTEASWKFYTEGFGECIYFVQFLWS